MPGRCSLLLVPLLLLAGGCARKATPGVPGARGGAAAYARPAAAPQRPGSVGANPYVQPAAPAAGVPSVPLLIAQQSPSAGVTLTGVLQAVDSHFPDLAVAQAEIQAAEAKLLSAEGEFDTVLTVDSLNQVEGFYENQRLKAQVEQPFENSGTTVKTGYRYGLGDFPSYEGGFKTNAGGEFFVAVNVPLLRDNKLDRRRADLLKARIARNAADPEVRTVHVHLTRKASAAYWKAVAASEKVAVAQSLLDLARTRRASLAEKVAQGEYPELIVLENDRLIAQREAILIATTRDFERAAIRLSLYYRDAGGRPVRVALGELPSFPDAPPIQAAELEEHIRFGLAYRPELQVLKLKIASANVDRAKKSNEMLPKMDLYGYASQDVGGSTTARGIYDDFELDLGVGFELPLRRRSARGGLALARARLTQLHQKARLAEDKVEGEIRDAASAYARAREEYVAALRSGELAVLLEQAEREALDAGDSDLLRVNLREQSSAKARSDVISAQAKKLLALADYKAAMGMH